MLWPWRARAPAPHGRPPHTEPAPHDKTTMSTPSPLAKYRYRRRLPHIQKADANLFVTFCTSGFQLPGAARDLVLGHSLREHGN